MNRIPVLVPIVVSAVFHYLGPALAVLLFAHIAAPGVLWLRIASAALVFAAWRRAWVRSRATLALGVVLAAMNTVFYLAIARLPLATVGAIEFLGVIALAAAGVRTRRNAAALGFAVAGVAALTEVRLAGEPLGFVFAFANCALFMAYIAIGHRIAADGDGIDRLAGAMLVAAVVAAPFGLPAAAPAFAHPVWLAAGIGVGVCSSVVPYVADQLVMARVRRSTFALLLSALPASATVIGLVVLGQLPTWRDLLGIGLVAAGLALHQERAEPSEHPGRGTAAVEPDGYRRGQT
ncbi:EamA family transporter [Dactylosporangium sp. CA-139066]|uniref:EamA family transporter n=1 Tax=Dactylosporangium sp. CA-139066 TaxID=3239930 RepID=UPI003D93FA32